MSHNESSQTYRHVHRTDEKPSEAVYSTVARLEGCSPLDLTPLANATDPEALDAILAGDSGAVRIVFEYCGYEVVATTDGIHVEEATDSSAR